VKKKGGGSFVAPAQAAKKEGIYHATRASFVLVRQLDAGGERSYDPLFIFLNLIEVYQKEEIGMVHQCPYDLPI
jgi:hypothetical protein